MGRLATEKSDHCGHVGLEASMGLTGAQNERAHRNAGRDHLFIFGIENEIAGRGAAGFATLGWGGLSAGGAAAARAPAGPARVRWPQP